LFASWNVEGVCSFDGKTLSSFNPNDDRMVHAILEDKKGNLWFGTRNNGACFYDGKTFTNFNDLEIFKSSCIYAMTEDDAGNIWFATEPGGVWCYKPSDSLIPSSKDDQRWPDS
jgi:ligand-binding sensor domain-containing protein